MADRSEKLDQAKQALLDEIIKSAGTTPGSYVLDLAEAYAWIMYPNNAHGGGKAAQ